MAENIIKIARLVYEIGEVYTRGGVPDKNTILLRNLTHDDKLNEGSYTGPLNVSG